MQLNKILLTGGMGYIGSHTAVVLTEAGFDVVLYDNLSNSKRSVLDQLEKITGKLLPFIEGDVRDTAHIEQTLRQHDIGAVIHFSGLKAVGESVEKPIDYYDNNIAGSISLLQAMRATDVKTLVFSSSATVYGKPQYLPLDEEHPTSATNPYGRSKLHIEEMLTDVAKSDSIWRIASLRYFNPVGAHESGLIGEDPNDTPNNLMPYIAQVASGKLPHLNVFGNDYNTKDGTGVRDYIHVMDLAEGHLATLNYLNKLPTKSGQLQTYNLGTGTGYSVLQMVKAFEEASGQTIPYQIAPRRSGDITTCYAKVGKAQQQLDWKASRSLEQMCSSTWKFQSDRRCKTLEITDLNKFIMKVHAELQTFVHNCNNFSKERSICLTGGRTAKSLYEHDEVQNLLHKDFLNFYFGDERCVGLDHPESNYKLAVDSLFPSGISCGSNLHRIQGENDQPEAEADRYAALLPESLDVLLLSVGEDGHIASLFPNSTAVTEENRKVLPVMGAPKPPAERLTITPSVIRSAKKVIVIATGREKGKILSDALKSPSAVTELPVRLTIGSTWVLDQAAADSFMKSASHNHHRTRIIYA